MKDNVFKLSFKSKGDISSSGFETEYYYTLAKITANNMIELGKQATDIIEKNNLDIDDCAVDLFNEYSPYQNANATKQLF